MQEKNRDLQEQERYWASLIMNDLQRTQYEIVNNNQLFHTIKYRVILNYLY